MPHRALCCGHTLLAVLAGAGGIAAHAVWCAKAAVLRVAAAAAVATAATAAAAAAGAAAAVRMTHSVAGTLSCLGFSSVIMSLQTGSCRAVVWYQGWKSFNVRCRNSDVYIFMYIANGARVFALVRSE
jgi:hypothetical protein